MLEAKLAVAAGGHAPVAGRTLVVPMTAAWAPRWHPAAFPPAGMDVHDAGGGKAVDAVVGFATERTALPSKAVSPSIEPALGPKPKRCNASAACAFESSAMATFLAAGPAGFASSAARLWQGFNQEK